MQKEFELKRMVEWKKLGDICYISDYVSNGSFASLRENVQYKSEPDYAILVRFADYSNGFDTSKFVYIDKHAYHFLSKSYLEGGEIIMSNVGSCGLLFRCPKLDRKMSLAPNSILIKSEFIDYLYYWLGGNVGQEEIRKITSKSAMPKFNKTEFKKIQVPIPSHSEQNRIVGILDTFTASIDNLKEQIAQRRKQYEYYRDQLLDLEGKEEKSIGELFVFKNGLNKEKKFFGQGNPIVNYTDVYHNNKLFSETLKGRVTLDKDEVDRFRVQRGDVFFTRTSETPEEIGYAAVLLDNIDNCTFSGFLLRARPTTNLLLPEYCGYCFSSYKVRKTIIKLSTYTTRALTNGTSLSKISIPVPSLEEQSRIVSILDTFEASIQNLEAQLAQREKQYEYYRNKLLTFE